MSWAWRPPLGLEGELGVGTLCGVTLSEVLPALCSAAAEVLEHCGAGEFVEAAGIGERDAAVFIDVEVVAHSVAVLQDLSDEGGEIIGNEPGCLEDQLGLGVIGIGVGPENFFDGELGGFVEDRIERVVDGVLRLWFLEDFGIARVVCDPFGYGAFALWLRETCRNYGGNWGVIAACFVTGSGGTGGSSGVDDDVSDLPRVK